MHAKGERDLRKTGYLDILRGGARKESKVREREMATCPHAAMSESGFDAEKLARLQALKKVGAKGTQRRKIVSVRFPLLSALATHPALFGRPRAAPADDQKLQAALKKLAVQPSERDPLFSLSPFATHAFPISPSQSPASRRSTCSATKDSLSTSTPRKVSFYPPSNLILPLNSSPTPAVHAAASSNVFAIYGGAQQKMVTDILPGMLPFSSRFQLKLIRYSAPGAMSQLGGDEMSYLKNMASLMQAREAANKSAGVEDIDDGESSRSCVPVDVADFAICYR